MEQTVRNPTRTRHDEGPVTARWGAGLLLAAGLLFAVYPALRPYSDETTLDGASAMASDAWMVSHLCAIAALILLPLGLLGLRTALLETPGRRAAGAGALLGWLGAGAVLPYYGVEVFGLQAISAEAARAGDVALLELAEDIRFGAVPALLFGTGMILLAAAGVCAARAVRNAGTARPWFGVPLAAALVLFLPQFFGPPALRIAHGLLFAAGCALLAAELWRRPPVPEPQAAGQRS
ncbi:hypothetical protein PJ985_17465 [Streptomyces sp. ACA25]|uniref:hypothetical protein n=1 Tax=Streptomyces sp. ACA25 TaxID=3022596 RepID=UPI002307316B|nr:hypothetical protein [Streptomyces sp. ACA25]MDB1089355.1 hypothetical protein [Streptomyces sp. ACA25]